GGADAAPRADRCERHGGDSAGHARPVRRRVAPGAHGFGARSAAVDPSLPAQPRARRSRSRGARQRDPRHAVPRARAHARLRRGRRGEDGPGVTLGAPTLRPRTWLAGLFVVSLLISLPGIGAQRPIDAHEAFVARTATEMSRRGEWAVPWFNDEIRLQKPPLSYWLAMGVHAAAGG